MQQAAIEQIGLAMAPQPMPGGAPGMIGEASEAPAMDEQQAAVAAQPQEAQMQYEQGTALPDQYSGMPTEEEMAAQQQAAQEQAASDQQLLAQQPQVDPYQQQGQEQMQNAQLQDGMNTGIDPSILGTLAQLKDSGVMDAGVISMIIDSESINEVVDSYKGDILNGASAIGRILLNALVKRAQIENDIGEKKYKQFTKNLRAIFVKMSELYADILKMELESDGKMES
jgi:hypothetical protein